MQDRPKVVMIVLNYNSLKKLGERVLYFIRSIASTNYSNFEIIVVDNGSIDGSDKLIGDELGRLGRGRVVKVEKNLGSTRGNNLGFKLACRDAKYVAFLNNDIEVEPDWLDKIIDVLEADERVAAAQPAILQLSNRNRVDSLGGMIDRVGWTYDLFSNSIYPDNLERPFEVFWAKAAAIVVRSDVFRIVGGFDEDYFIYYDEVDLCWRIRLLGYKVVTVPTARIYHLGSGTMGGANFRSIYMSRKNHLAMLLKNYSFVNAIFYSILLILIYVSAVVKESFRGRKVVSFAVLTALAWNFRNLRKTLRKRVYMQSIRKIPDKQIQNHMFRIREYKTRR
jgi:GT2 family glycosyltransferase